MLEKMELTRKKIYTKEIKIDWERETDREKYKGKKEWEEYEIYSSVKEWNEWKHKNREIVNRYNKGKTRQ